MDSVFVFALLLWTHTQDTLSIVVCRELTLIGRNFIPGMCIFGAANIVNDSFISAFWLVNIDSPDCVSVCDNVAKVRADLTSFSSAQCPNC